MQIKSKGVTFQDKMKYMKNIRGYDPNLDFQIEKIYQEQREWFWIVYCEMTKYNSWTKWAKDYDYPLQFLADNPNYGITRVDVKDVFLGLHEDAKDEAIDYSRAGLSTSCPICTTMSNPVSLNEIQDNFLECKNCENRFINVYGVLVKHDA